MDFQFTKQQKAFRCEVRSFLVDRLGPDWRGIDPDGYFENDNWPLIRSLTAALSENGWVTLAWPEEYGGQGRSLIEQMAYNEELAYFRAPTRDMSIGVDLVGPTVMLYGTDEQKSRLLPPIASGNDVYCQGFSELEAGSDLASLQLRAVEDGDDFILNGSKVWTSGAHRATHCYLMARTEPEGPKHRGISVFIVDMDTPGIVVKPIVNMFDVHYFNQVLFENVRIPKANLIGEKNLGWYVATTSLDLERSGVAQFASNQRNMEEMMDLARVTDLNGEPIATNLVFRNRLATLWVSNEAGRMVAYRVAWMQSQGLVPNREASISKLMGSEIAQRIHQLGLRMMGSYGVLDKGSRWARLDGRLAWEWMDSISLTIRSGTSEIQRNIIATRGLGLPRT